MLSSLYEQGQLVMTISEEILTALDSRKRMLKPNRVRDLVSTRVLKIPKLKNSSRIEIILLFQVTSYDESPRQREWRNKIL